MKNFKKLALASVLCTGVCLTAGGQKPAPAIPSDPVIEAHIQKWLKKMTLEEKIGQMCEITIDVVSDFEASKKNGFTLNPAMLDTVIGKYKVGSLLNVPLSVAQKKEKWAEAIKQIQDLSMKEIGIPCIYGVDQIHGKEISYNNLLDINAAVDLIDEFEETTFAVLKHNNACGLASRPTVLEAWNDALAGDPVSAFGGVLITNGVVDKEAAEEINKIFFEVIIAPDYDVDALEILGQKKNRIILVRKPASLPKKQFRSLLNGVLVQDRDLNIEKPENLKTATTKVPTAQEIEDMLFANKIVKNSKSNAIVLAKGKQLLASGVGQTSRVDALKQAIEKAKNFGFDLKGAVMASDAFFPFPDCVEIAGNEGVTAVIQPGGSIKDELSFNYCNEHGIAMVITGFRHFKH